MFDHANVKQTLRRMSKSSERGKRGTLINIEHQKVDKKVWVPHVPQCLEIPVTSRGVIGPVHTLARNRESEIESKETIAMNGLTTNFLGILFIEIIFV